MENGEVQNNDDRVWQDVEFAEDQLVPHRVTNNPGQYIEMVPFAQQPYPNNVWNEDNLQMTEGFENIY